MAKRSRPRSYTVLVMGAPGHRVRRMHLRRSTLVMGSSLLLAVPFAAAAGGYTLATSGGNAALAAAHVASGEASPVQRAGSRTAEPPSADTAHAATTPTGPTAAPAVAQAASEPAVEAAPSDATLQLLPAGGGDTLELHPFAVDDTPRAGAFEQLGEQLACSDGKKHTPTPALVRMLMRAQNHFERPALVLGGRCGAHDDDGDARRQHQLGRAVDVRLPGVSSKRLSDWLSEQGAGGVGRYGRRGFVHLDVREGTQARWEEQTESAETAHAEPRPARRRAEVAEDDTPSEPSADIARPTEQTAPSAPTEPVETALSP